ncbi:unnamed protein product [Chilo suppressalis]|uniref:EGF-like domain-containing protein n=1 Tax=Chilo suppressalis TaxID=168631 RepID=A0ABN8B424_CHISP|nr:unnamed protein product [Chilo suppressalis]
MCDKFCVQEGTCTTDATTTPKPDTSLTEQCEEFQYKCPNASLCVERSQVCDGRQDCPGGGDELTALCESLTCQPHEFMCTSGSCILDNFKCDGEPDCPDESDEFGCIGRTCRLGFFQCHSKECVEMSKRCDGNQDCFDSSDEDGCQSPIDLFDEEPEHHCPEGEIACELNKTICLPPSARCNMKTDCPGGTDESGCDRRCAPHNMFECKQEYMCVPLRVLCNGIKDCQDGSDEAPEACAKVNMTSRLYPPSLYPSAECHEGFLCGSGQCIEWRDVCDQVPHCFDGSDEHGLCNTACQNNSCAYSCQATPQGAHCRCPPGLRTSADHLSCEDLDECAHGVCSHKCHNVPGSFLCSCYHGYSLRPDRRSCKASKGDMSIVYVSRNTVWSVAIDGQTTLVYNETKGVSIADIALDIRKNKLYVTLTEAGKLIEVNASKSNTVVTNIGKPTKVAVDWITGNVYFVDSTPGASCIRVCNVGKKRCAKLQKLPANGKVTSLVLEPAWGRMFYVVWSRGRAVVWSGGLGGRHAADLAAAGGAEGGVSVAAHAFIPRLYVAETHPARITAMDLDGEHQKLIVYNHTEFQGLRDLVLFEDSIYFLTTNSLYLNRCSLFGKKQCEPFIHRDVAADTFVLRHESVQRDDVHNSCESFECDNVCVLEQNGPQCVCDDGSIASGGKCPLFEKQQLPLFNGWTSEQYRRAHSVMFGMITAIVVLLTLYLAIFVYYQVLRPRWALATPYMEVRYQHRGEDAAAASSMLDIPTPADTSESHEFVNPLQYVRDAWMQIRGDKRPIGTEGLRIDVPRQENEDDLSDTESDLDVRDTTNIVPDKLASLTFVDVENLCSTYKCIVDVLKKELKLETAAKSKGYPVTEKEAALLTTIFRKPIPDSPASPSVSQQGHQGPSKRTASERSVSDSGSSESTMVSASADDDSASFTLVKGKKKRRNKRSSPSLVSQPTTVSSRSQPPAQMSLDIQAPATDLPQGQNRMEESSRPLQRAENHLHPGIQLG